MTKPKILLAMPGPNIRFPTAQSCFTCCGKGYHMDVVGADNASWDNFNALWITALNGTKTHGYTHFAMIHADICPDLNQDWVSILIEEMESKGASFISGVSAIKDGRGVTSSGIGDPECSWFPYRRFTMHEIMRFPETFDQDDIGYSGYALNHNSGLIMADIRNPAFHTVLPDGEMAVWFEFKKKVYMDDDGVIKLKGESEDWNFSRRIWQQGIQSCITRKTRALHYGTQGYPNYEAFGEHVHDEATRDRWEKTDPIESMFFESHLGHDGLSAVGPGESQVI